MNRVQSILCDKKNNRRRVRTGDDGKTGFDGMNFRQITATSDSR